MSVKTTADEELDNVRENIRAAIKSLSRIIVDECWGHDEFAPEFRESLDCAYIKLMEIKKEMSQ